MTIRLAAAAALACVALLAAGSSADAAHGCPGRGGATPAWSPAGQEIAWLSFDADGICFAQADGSGRQFLRLSAAHQPPYELLWPSSDLLVALSNSKIYSIAVWPKPHILPAGEEYFGEGGDSFSLDSGGGLLATESCSGFGRCNSQLVLVRPGGRRSTMGAKAINGYPSLSPSGRAVVWQEKHAIVTESTSTKGIHPEVIGNGSCPLWSPAAGKIAYLTRGVTLVSPSGRTTHTIGDDVGPASCAFPQTLIAWSPNGRYIAFVNASNRLSIVDVQTRRERHIVRFHFVNSLAWSPDSAQLLLGVGQETPTGCSTLWRMRVDGTASSRVSRC